MERYEEEGEDSDNETDPEQLLNEWLGELDSLTVIARGASEIESVQWQPQCDKLSTIDADERLLYELSLAIRSERAVSSVCHLEVLLL
ncbi:hypothetical protein ANTQUA_LOCUS8868 [Anthophora quadrimaculata]